MARTALLRGLGNGLLALASIAVALVFAEFGLRLYFYGSLATPDYGQTLHLPHEARGWTLRPNIRANKAELDYNVPVSVNSLGLRGPEVGYARTAGTFRILVVGDSAMFGSGVDDDTTVPALLSRMLAPLKVEVVNLSVAAYSTTQEYLFFMDEGRKYRPDLVLLAVSPGNDLQTNYAPLQSLYQKSQRRPFAALDAQGRLVIDTRHAEREAKRRARLAERGAVADALRNAVLLRLVNAAWEKFVGARGVDPNIYPGWPHLAGFDPAFGPHGRTSADYEKLWGEAWRVTRALISEIQSESHALGARFGILMASSMLQGDARAQARVHDAFPGIRLDVDKIDREMERFAGEIGAPFITALPALRAAAATATGPLFYQFQDEHWTPAGSRVAAEAIAQGLRAKGLVPGGPGGLSEGGPKRGD